MMSKFSQLSLISLRRASGARALSAPLLLLMAVCQLFGQIDRGTIEGVVKDQSGARRARRQGADHSDRDQQCSRTEHEWRGTV